MTTQAAVRPHDANQGVTTDRFPLTAYPAHKDAAVVSELSTKGLEFCAASLAEIAEKID